MDLHHKGPASLPFTEDDLIGPDDRPKQEWEIIMWEWQAFCNTTVKDWLDEASGTGVRAVQCAARPDEGLVYVRTCVPEAPKAHSVTVSPNFRTATFSLFSTLQAFDFPKVNSTHKTTFKCRPETYGDVKLLVIEVTGYRVEKVDRETQEQVAAALSLSPGGKF
ncbi:MAG: hypothetical protein K0R39_4219 [Symbiobacteriaceae bacterium]|jgi:hypothetical protein|nr:hypothetical protein [Symbiobacteriaceae bacterium]